MRLLFISKNALTLIEIIENSGFEAFAVGGCVRDSLMHKQCHDIDITTSASPFEVEKILSENNIGFIETGLKHGTITALLNGQPFEITTYRADGEYKDNRHPENVEFVSDIKEDLSRRDFTINAMAYNHSKGVVDLFSGQEDIKNKLIRAVGDANKRFNEDALRIMRAIRFASVLSFDIEENTKKAIFDNKELLKNVSAERLFTELSKLLLGDNAYQILIDYREILAVIIPELTPMFDCAQNNPWHIYDVYTHTCKSVVSCPEDLNLRLTMLLHDIGKPIVKTTDQNGVDHFKKHQAESAKIASDILKRFKVSNDIYNFAMTLIPIHDITLSPNKKCIKKWLNKLGQGSSGEYYLKHLLNVRLADRLSQNPEKTYIEIEEINYISGLIDNIIEENEAFKISDLNINGFDLMSLGIKGKEIGETLNLLLDKVIDEELENEKSILIEYVKKNTLDLDANHKEV